MKRTTFITQLEARGYTVTPVENGMDICDGFGWRAFVSDAIRLGVNTCALEFPDADYAIINRYIRTPLDKR